LPIEEIEETPTTPTKTRSKKRSGGDDEFFSLE